MATARRAGVLCLVYTSPSHGPARPRWRVLCPAGGEIAPADRSRLLDRLDALFGGMFGRESWTLSQAYHYGSVAGRPAPMVEIVDGVSIDEIGLDPDADDEDAGLGFEDIDPDEIICGHPPEFWRRISEGIAEGARHPLMRSLAGLLIGDPMLETHLAIALIRSFAKTHCDPPFGGKELDRIIDWVARKELRG